MKRKDGAPTAQVSADPPRNFTLTVDERIRALTIGVPSWAARKRKIEDDEDRFVLELTELHDTLSGSGRAARDVEAALFAAAASFDLAKLNELVRVHNRYYPVEANLPMDRETGAYLIYGVVWRPETEYTAARLVALAYASVAAREAQDD